MRYHSKLRHLSRKYLIVRLSVALYQICVCAPPLQCPGKGQCRQPRPAPVFRRGVSIYGAMHVCLAKGRDAYGCSVLIVCVWEEHMANVCVCVCRGREGVWTCTHAPPHTLLPPPHNASHLCGNHQPYYTCRVATSLPFRRAFTSTAVGLSLVLLNAGVDLVSFSGILYSIYPPLFAALIAYSLSGSAISILVGKVGTYCALPAEFWILNLQSGPE
jgi:hypothetical protein